MKSETFYVLQFKSPTRLIENMSSSIIWEIQTVPIVFGEDVNLKCIVPTGVCHINQTKQWTGGKGYKLLGLNGYTTDISKYAMKVHTSELSFDLTVKNFSEDDANREYTCLCGKEQYTDMLMLNKTEYIRMPLEDNIIVKSYVNDYRIYLNLTIQNVHPLPICTLEYNNKTKILKTSDCKKENNTVYTIAYKSVISMKESCRITWLVNCTVGQKSFNTDKKTSNQCGTNYGMHDVEREEHDMEKGQHIRLQNVNTATSVLQPMLKAPQIVDFKK
ncbi:OBSCN [Mytilus coruscus]|uniref:OBSCN n=1 Tax=Mytilus coruscus TaxID=42192 RepID=A0A6J7ZYD2_MYTCO|nr:OBSCN [Mytilus coruscus]